ncbi:MAG: hypothetical protein ABIH21_05240 [Patescibacteria group bacterium]
MEADVKSQKTREWREFCIEALGKNAHRMTNEWRAHTSGKGLCHSYFELQSGGKFQISAYYTGSGFCSLGLLSEPKSISVSVVFQSGAIEIDAFSLTTDFSDEPERQFCAKFYKRLRERVLPLIGKTLEGAEFKSDMTGYLQTEISLPVAKTVLEHILAMLFANREK